MTRKLGISLAFFLFFAACTKHAPPPPPMPPSAGLRTQKPYRVNGVWYYPLPTAKGYRDEGMASWYGADFHGKPTSCGEPYNMNALTAAHKTLPLGTHVKVTHLGNGRSTVVRVNDRGPFVAGRIIDLSRRASQELRMMQSGLARVRVEAVQMAQEQQIGRNTYWSVEPVPSFRYGLFSVQIGSFENAANARRLKKRMASRYNEVQILPFTHEGRLFYRVQVGSFKDILVAQQELERLRRQGFGDAFVIASDGR